MADLSSSPRRLVVHCGVQKTGTTSLHHFLSANREALEEHLQILTPERRSLTRRLGRSSAEYTAAPSPESKLTFISNIEAMRTQLLLGKGPSLLSHENLPGAMLGWGKVRTLYPMVTEVIDLLDEHLAPLVPEYVFYCRDMAIWKTSVHNQAVKTNGYAETYPTFLEETADCGTWEELESRVTAHIGAERSTFFRLEDEVPEGIPGRQLLRHAGLTDGQIDALKPLANRRNQSLNAGALEFMRLMNGQTLNPKARAKISQLIVKNQSLFRLKTK